MLVYGSLNDHAVHFGTVMTISLENGECLFY